ncbi:MAG TPA: TonB-dependent receptor [Burkholderiales bacterium]|nr:TonB-dependent receptor [Burkholderiales bacterium]
MLTLCNTLASYDARGLRINPNFAAALLALAATQAWGQDSAKETSLPEITIKAAPSVAQKYQLPATTESVTAEQMAETINVMNTEDALKYLPSLIVRKRNFGDQQSPLATRTSGLGQSARSLIYADGVLLSTLIGNNNSGASPRWALVAPEEIERIEVMYGPFSAAYPGNSMGAVVEIITRMPQKFEAGAKAQGAVQDYSLYGTSSTYRSEQASVILGNRTGDLSWWLSANHLHSQTQPITIITALRPAAPSAAGTPTTGAFMDVNKLGQPIAVIGSGGLETKNQDTFKAKVAYDFTPEWRGAYTLGFFQNDAKSKVDTYLRDAAGNPVFSGASLNIGGFNFTNIGATSFSSTSGFYNLAQEHTAHSLSLKSNMQREWDWEAVVSDVRFGLDTFRFPGTALPAAAGGGAGSILSMSGTGWSTLDLKGFWRPQGPKGAHQVSFGVHADRYNLVNPTFAAADWIGGSNGAITANSLGKTGTNALWIQDAWRFAPQFKLTLGARAESWRAFDGFNFVAPSAAVPAGSSVSQPTITSSKFSPKASLAWEPNNDWKLTASYGTAYRFPTVSELYQAITVAGVVFTPNPDLRPERAYSGELALERVIDKGRVRVSLFQESLADALISQNSIIPGTNTIGASIQNIDRVRSQGIELVAEKSDAPIRGLDLSGSVTWVDSKILSDPGFRNVAGVLTDVTGKYTPNIPRLKLTALATYRYDARLSGTLGARYSDRVWTTIDNSDPITHTFGGFDSYLVVDARLRYQFDKQWSAALGVDNLNNRKYFLFHPFPQRTFVAELKFAL